MTFYQEKLQQSKLEHVDHNNSYAHRVVPFVVIAIAIWIPLASIWAVHSVDSFNARWNHKWHLVTASIYGNPIRNFDGGWSSSAKFSVEGKQYDAIISENTTSASLAQGSELQIYSTTKGQVNQVGLPNMARQPVTAVFGTGAVTIAAGLFGYYVDVLFWGLMVGFEKIIRRRK